MGLQNLSWDCRTYHAPLLMLCQPPSTAVMQSCTARAFVSNTSTAFALLGSDTAEHSRAQQSTAEHSTALHSRDVFVQAAAN